LITEIPFEVFTYSETDPMCFEETPEDPFPYMVCSSNAPLSGYFTNFAKWDLTAISSFTGIFQCSWSTLALESGKYIDKQLCRKKVIPVKEQIWKYGADGPCVSVFLSTSILKVTSATTFERISGTSVRLFFF